MQDNQTYDYLQAGFDAFLNRSIDANTVSTQSLNFLPPIATGQQLNYDQMHVTGALGDNLQIGNITLDGASGRISIFDDEGNEIVRLGAL
jgi:hypothetical protein